MNNVLDRYNELVELFRNIKGIGNAKKYIYIEGDEIGQSGNSYYYNNEKYEYTDKLVQDDVITRSEKESIMALAFKVFVEIINEYKSLLLPQYNIMIIKIESNGEFDVDYYYCDNTMLRNDFKIYNYQQFFEYKYMNKETTRKSIKRKIERFKKGEIPIFTNKFTLKEILEGKKFNDFWHPEYIGVNLTDDNLSIEEIDEKIDLLKRSKNNCLVVYIGDDAMIDYEEAYEKNDIRDYSLCRHRINQIDLGIGVDFEAIKYIMERVLEGDKGKGVLLKSFHNDEEITLKICKGKELGCYLLGANVNINVSIELAVTEEYLNEFCSTDKKDLIIKENGMDISIRLS